MGRIRSTLSRVLLLSAVLALLGGLLPVGMTEPVAVAAPATQIIANDEVIVVLRDGVNPAAAARDLGVEPTYIYRHVFSGFAGTLPTSSVAAANRSSLVELISPHVPLEADAQVIPTGVRRIRAQDAWPSPNPAAINAGVAVLDSGIQKRQAPPRKRCDQSDKQNQRKCNRRQRQQSQQAHDLTIDRGTRCIGSEAPTIDRYGHGTHVAGTIGARDNSYGAVGVAPGVRLYAVKVLDDRGVGSVSSIVCGLDWVHKHMNLIDVVNMSLGGRGPADTSRCSSDALHLAVCRVVNRAGIAVVVSSGNDGRDAANFIPAAYAEAITVSAFADTNGEPPPPVSSCQGQGDDTYATFSNFGEVVDITAPGVCIRSTRPRGGTFLLSGTSMAAPHVAGALALFYAENPGATVDQARAWLLNDASVPQVSPNGLIAPGPSDEPVLFLEGALP